MNAAAQIAEMRQWVEAATPDTWQTYPLLVDEARWLLDHLDKLEAAVLQANATINELSWEGDGLARMEPDRTNALRLRNVMESVASTLDAETLGLLGRDDQDGAR